MDLQSVDSFGSDLFSTEDLQEQNDLEQETSDMSSVDAWRQYFQEKKKDDEERAKKRPKVPLWIFQDQKKAHLPNLKSVSIKIDSVRQCFMKACALFWDEINECLHFVDAGNRTFVRYTPATDDLKVATYEAEGEPSFMIPIIQNNYEYMVGIGNTVYRMEWNGKTKEVAYLSVLDVEGKEGDRVIYGKADPVGRLVMTTQKDTTEAEHGKGGGGGERRFTDYIKTYEPPDKYTNVTKKLQVGDCTGIAWDWRGHYCYIINTNKHLIHVFFYALEMGRIFIQEDDIKWEGIHEQVKGFPQCLTCDLEDHLWVGCSIPGQLISLNPKTQSIHRIINLKPQYLAVTSLVFGNFNRDVLYVTTLNWFDTKPRKSKSPESPKKKPTSPQRGKTTKSPPHQTPGHPTPQEAGAGKKKQRQLGQSSLLRVSNLHARGLGDYRVKYYGELDSHDIDEKEREYSSFIY